MMRNALNLSVIRSTLRLALASGLLLGLSACTTTTAGVGLLGSMVSSMSGNSSVEQARERAENQVLAQDKAVAEKHPDMHTESAYLGLVAEMQKKSLWFASLAHLDALEAKWGPSDTSRLLRADALRQTGSAQASAALYQQLLQGSKAAPALHGLGLIAASQQQFPQAVASLEAARRLTPTNPLLLNDLGFALLHTGQPATAQVPLMQAAQLQPNHPRIQSNVALFLVLHGAGNEALEWMNVHQMSEEMRLQVFGQAQRLASLASVVAVAVEQAAPAEQAVPVEQAAAITPTVGEPAAVALSASTQMDAEPPLPSRTSAVAASPSAWAMLDQPQERRSGWTALSPTPAPFPIPRTQAAQP